MAFRPQTFANVEDPQELRRYLLELQQELARALGETNQLSPVVTSATYAANYDEIVRIDPPSGGTTVILPPPSIAKAGATVTLTVVGDGGQVTLECVGGQVNNASSFAFQAGVGDVVCRLDGPRGWFIPSAELSSSGPADAQYYVGAADGSLPNARLGTASTEITPSHAVTNVVTWALNTASVVLAKLQDLTGLSVLGRAANSTGVMAAITASASRQTLTVNDAGTSLAWGDPVEVRERGTDVGDAYALDYVNGPGMTAHASVASRVGEVQFCLAAHRIKPEPSTGIIDTSDWNDYDAIYFTGAQPEVQNIPQPVDPDGNAYEKVLWLIGSTVVAPLTIRHNTGTGTGRIFCPNLRDSEQFQLSSSQLVYNTVENRWFVIANTSVVAEANNDGTLLIGRSLNFMNAPAGLTWTLSKSAGEIRITPTLANIPLTALANIADDTWLGNISGGAAPPTANTLSSLGGTKLTYNATSHAFDWDGMEGRIGGADAGDFVGIDFTNGAGNVTFSLASGAGGTFGVVASATIAVHDDSVDQGDFLTLDFLQSTTVATTVTPVGTTAFVGHSVRDGSIDNAKLANMPAGTQKGRRIDGGTGPPVDLTGAEQFENLRRDTIQVETVSGDTDITLAATTTKLVLNFTADTNLRGISGADDSGREVLVELFRSSGAGTYVTVPHSAETPGGTNRIFNPDSEDMKLDHRDAFVISARGNVWRVHGLTCAPFFNQPTDADRDILIHDGDEWEKENLTTAVDGAAPGRLLAYTAYANGASGTHTYDANTGLVIVKATGGGGGGGSCAGGGTTVGGGGQGGATVVSSFAPGGSSASYSVGSGGAGGTSGGSGTNGSTTTFTGATSALGGLGGIGGSLGDVLVAGGGNSSTSSQGNAGGTGVVISTNAAGGTGGPSHYGGGGFGPVRTSTGTTTGSVGRRPGAGGSGSCTVSSVGTPSGGAGADGLIEVWEYTA